MEISAVRLLSPHRPDSSGASAPDVHVAGEGNCSTVPAKHVGDIANPLRLVERGREHVEGVQHRPFPNGVSIETLRDDVSEVSNGQEARQGAKPPSCQRSMSGHQAIDIAVDQPQKAFMLHPNGQRPERIFCVQSGPPPTDRVEIYDELAAYFCLADQGPDGRLEIRRVLEHSKTKDLVEAAMGKGIS